MPLNLQHAPSPSWHPEEPPINPTTLPGQRQGRSWATPAPSLHFWMNRVDMTSPPCWWPWGCMRLCHTKEGWLSLQTLHIISHCAWPPSLAREPASAGTTSSWGTRPRGLLPVRVCGSGPKYTFWRLSLCEGHISLRAWVSFGLWRPPVPG